MKLIVGLGNPGKKYENTRHNIGFRVIDSCSKKWNIAVEKVKFDALIGEGRVNNERIILAKPLTYMNLSGESVRQIMQYYKLNTEDLLVVYDDIDVAVGKLRIRQKGSAGTHNGMRSIIYELKDDGFPRFRMGVSKPQGQQDLASYVLCAFPEADRKTISDVVDLCVDALEAAITDGIDISMNRFNRR